MMFGAGGVFAEVLDDVSYSTIPVTKTEATELIESTKIGHVLSGYRERSYETEDLANLLVTLSDLVYSNDQIKEIEFNPVIVREDDIRVIDLLLTVE
jgi:hypothetical protein